MRDKDAEHHFQEGLDALSQGNCLAALACFERALSLDDRPLYRSYVAYGIAKERGQVRRAEEICRETIELEPTNPHHYLNLGRVLLVTHRKSEAIEVFRSGLQFGQNDEIMSLLNSLVTRKPPILPFLKRSNPLNKYLGIILRRLLRW